MIHAIRNSIALVGVVSALLLLVWGGSIATGGTPEVGQAPLPTSTRPPTPAIPSTPAVQPTRPPNTEIAGGWIELRVRFSPAETEPQALWTIVQWQDTEGRWHNVDGWQGTFDEIHDGWGVKRWWLDQTLFAHGPFRWLIYRSKEDTLLTVSDPFFLPEYTGQTTYIELPLLP